MKKGRRPVRGTEVPASAASDPRATAEKLPAGSLVFETLVPGSNDVAPTVTLGRVRWIGPDEFAAVGMDGDLIGLFAQRFEVGVDTIATRRRLAGYIPGAAVESFDISPDGSEAILALENQSRSISLVDGLTGLE